MGVGSIEALEGILGCELSEAAGHLNGRGSRSQFVVDSASGRLDDPQQGAKNDESPGFPWLS